MPVRFGFVGLDHWYNAFPTLDALVQHPAAHVVALTHRDAVRAGEAGARYGIPVLPTAEAVIGRDDVDVVCSFVSADENAGVCIRAAQAGKAVIAIKPMGMDLDEADRVVAAVRAADVAYFPNDAARRFSPTNQQMRVWLDEGRIGDLVAAHCLFRAGLPEDWPGSGTPGWFADPARVPGGGFLDHAVYHVDVLRWFFGAEVVEARGMTGNVRHKQIAVEDYGHAVFRFENGAIGSVEDTWTSNPGASRETMELIGSRGSMLYDTATGRLALTGDFGLPGWLQVAPAAPRGGFVGHVIRCMQGEEEPASSAEASRANLAACLAFYEAARGGRPVAPAPPAVPAAVPA